MTRRAEGSPRGVPRIWLAPIVWLAGLLTAAGTGQLSRSVVLDLAAWWPVWLIVALAVPMARGRSLGKVRASGLVPLVAVVGLAVFTMAHLQGWPSVPSGSVRLIGPEVGGVAQTELSADVGGQLMVGGGARFLYEVEPVRRGGDIAVPEAVEGSTGTSVTVALVGGQDPGWYGFSGWEVRISTRPTWSLRLTGDIRADLTGLDVSEARMSGEGVTLVGPVAGSRLIFFDGSFELVVQPGAQVRVVGEAEVPESWDRLSDGWQTPDYTAGWVVEVPETSSLVVTER